MKILLDTGIVSRYITQDAKVVSKVNQYNPDNFYISVISFIELQNWLSDYITIDKKERENYKKAIKAFRVVHIDEEISELAFSYSVRNPNDRVNDLLIVATKKIKGFKILTLNSKHFDKYK